MLRLFQRFTACSRGATAVEYAFITLLIFLAVVGGIAALGDSVFNKYEHVNREVSNAVP